MVLVLGMARVLGIRRLGLGCSTRERGIRIGYDGEP